MTYGDIYADLSARIGEEIHVSDWLTVTQEMIDRFAEATGDHQWIHVDTERAATQSPFGATIAHGFLTLSLYPRLRDLVEEDRPICRPRSSDSRVISRNASEP